ncbi:hypothetical protein EVAR_39865_1 [Eumeta japonica]|uniref:Uncharacterized protein n=1 Tax=Eumeta variegata TaxID=151549 RepID=A0A4C1WR21_EUMVA|nr:hypothetical protein EVAR_39865_1 [Eumeta japonica]
MVDSQKHKCGLQTLQSNQSANRNVLSSSNVTKLGGGSAYNHSPDFEWLEVLDSSIRRLEPHQSHRWDMLGRDKSEALAQNVFIHVDNMYVETAWIGIKFGSIWAIRVKSAGWKTQSSWPDLLSKKVRQVFMTVLSSCEHYLKNSEETETGQNLRLQGCVRPLSLFYSYASADGVEERSLVLRSRSYARLRRNATMSHAFSCMQPAFIVFIRRYHRGKRACELHTVGGNRRQCTLVTQEESPMCCRLREGDGGESGPMEIVGCWRWQRVM